MAATCAYAQSSPGQGGKGGSHQVADLFCRQARRRIEDHFRAMRRNDQRRANVLAKRVLAGEFEWMEAGIICNGLDDGPEASSE